MKTTLMIAAASLTLLALPAAASDQPAPTPVANGAAPANAPAAEAQPAPVVDGLDIRFFRCANGRAFTAKQFEGGASVTTASGKTFELRPDRQGGYEAQGVRYDGKGGLTGVSGEIYENCARS